MSAEDYVKFLKYAKEKKATQPPEMTLRDYFAGLAMQANLSTGFVVIDNAPVDRQHAEHARMAYAQADAMMEARKG